MRRSRITIFGVVILVLLGAAGGAVWANIPGSNGTITACYQKPGGNLRVIDADAEQSCRPGEETVTWNDGLTGKVADSDKLDGLDSTAFLSATGKAFDADKLDGLDSTAFLSATGKASDADKLDGRDSSAYGSGVLTGRIKNYAATTAGVTNAATGAVSGISEALVHPSALATLLPASVRIVDLKVMLTSAPGGQNGTTVQIFRPQLGGASQLTALACEVAGTATTCQAAGPSPVLNAGDPLIVIVSTHAAGNTSPFPPNNSPGTDVLFGFRVVPA